MRSLIFAASLVGLVTLPAMAQPRHHGVRHVATSFQALSPADTGTITHRAQPAPAAEYPCIWGALGRC